MSDESIIITIRRRRFFIKHLFRLSVVLSLLVHIIAFSGYFLSGNGMTKDAGEFQNTFELERPDIEMDIPAELIGGDTTPAPVAKQEWIEGTKKDGDDPVENDINTNRISGDGTDKDGYLFSFNGDAAPRAIVDFDLRQYYPREALDARPDSSVLVAARLVARGSGASVRQLPEALLRANPERSIRIPMLAGRRSLNLSNSAAIVLYEALRQLRFPGMETKSAYFA